MYVLRIKKGEMDLDDHPVPCPPCGELVSNSRPAPGRTDACYASECGNKRKPAPVWAVRDTLRDDRARPPNRYLPLPDMSGGAPRLAALLFSRVSPGVSCGLVGLPLLRGTDDPRADSETAWCWSRMP